MKYLVTGGCGFIGAHICAALVSDEHDVCVLDDLSTGNKAALPDAVSFTQGCVTDTGMLASLMADVEGVFHLAAIASVERCMQEWPHAQRVNVGGTVAVLDAARARKIPVVYASSAAVYGANDALPLSEDSATNPISTYGQDKLACEAYARLAWEHYAVPSVGLRFFNVYGLGQQEDSPYSGVITQFMHRIAQGKPLMIHGDGEQTRDFIHVSDIALLLQRAMERMGQQASVYNGCSGMAVSINSLAQQMIEAAGVSATIEHASARVGDIRFSYGNPQQASEALGFSASIPFAQGITSLVRDAGEVAA